MPSPIRFHRLTRGAAILEFTLVALPLLLVGLTVLEASRWQLARTLLSHALLEAGRGGQSGELDPQQIAERFEQAVLPLWPVPQAVANPETALLSLRQAAQGFQQRYGFPLWQIQPLPASAARTPIPGLILELTWWHRPWVPGMQALLRQLGRVPPTSTLRQGMASSGWLPIRQRIALEWHVHAEQVHAGPTASLPIVTPTLPAPGSGTSYAPWQLHEFGVGSGYRLPCRGLNCASEHPLPTQPPAASPTDPELCGTVLCCTPSNLAG